MVKSMTSMTMIAIDDLIAIDALVLGFVPERFAVVAARPPPFERQSARKPTFACEPSQNGLFCEWPHRHSASPAVRFTVRPVPEQISRFPLTRSGPLRCGRICNGPSRTSRAGVSPVAGSPEARKPAALWEPSQNGLFFEAPQRHS